VAEKEKTDAEILDDEITSIVSVTPSKEFGSTLVKAAMEQFQHDQQLRLVGFTQSLISQIRECQLTIVTAQRAEKFYRQKVLAMERGEFIFDDYGNVIFNEPALNQTSFAGAFNAYRGYIENLDKLL
jgi:hypothetical protein